MSGIFRCTFSFIWFQIWSLLVLLQFVMMQTQNGTLQPSHPRQFQLILRNVISLPTSLKCSVIRNPASVTSFQEYIQQLPEPEHHQLILFLYHYVAECDAEQQPHAALSMPPALCPMYLNHWDDRWGGQTPTQRIVCLAENNLSSTMLALWTDGIDANACFAVK